MRTSSSLLAELAVGDSPPRRRGAGILAVASACVLALVGASARVDAADPGSDTSAAVETGGAAAAAPSAEPTTDPWLLPASNVCAPERGFAGHPSGEDAPAVPFNPGDVIDAEKLALLQDFFPGALWESRDRFFYEGMRLVIGACFADYSPPLFFHAATERFRGKPRLLENGGLTDYVAGLPFDPRDITGSDPKAGLKWAWNIQQRYQAAGFRGKFRISDMVGREGRAEPFLGELFKIQLAHRSDQADNGHEDKRAKSKLWVAGGVFAMPFDARSYAWRQYRDIETETLPERTDDVHAYLPNWRRVRRVTGADVEGLYMPSFSVGVVQATTIGGVGAGIGGGVGGAGGIGAGGADAITTKRSGFEGLEIRPLLYHWSVIGVRDVLAPLNANAPSYPQVEDREFGPWGLSFASDRWDFRRALVVEGSVLEKRGAEDVARMILYVDLQTLAPLYYLSFDSKDESIDVGIYVGRWSEERERYPRWPDDPERPIRVIDSSGAAFAHLSDIGGWRRETFDAVSTPPSDRKLRQLISVNNLTKGR